MTARWLVRARLLAAALALAITAPLTAQAEGPLPAVDRVPDTTTDPHLRAIDFFRALDAVDADPRMTFVRLDELARAALASGRVDLISLRKLGDRSVEATRIARDLRMSRIALKVGGCFAARYWIAAPSGTVQRVESARASAAEQLRVVPAGRQLDAEGAARVCSGDTCVLSAKDGSKALTALAMARAVAPVADLGGRRPDAGATTSAAVTAQMPDDSLSADAADICQEGVLRDPRRSE
jgi:hypothetical protein